jgi:hypothetical protein
MPSGPVSGGLHHGARRPGVETTYRPYRGGRSPDWIKVKNRKHPAMERVMEAIR